MKRGFTTVELIVSSVLALAIVMFLFQIILLVNDVFIKNDKQTILLSDSSLVSYEINKKFSENTITKVSGCGADCYDITYGNGSVDKIQKIDDILEFGDYKQQFEGLLIKSIDINKVTAPTITNSVDSMLLLTIEVEDIEFDNNETINIMYQYSSDYSNIIYE